MPAKGIPTSPTTPYNRANQSNRFCVLLIVACGCDVTGSVNSTCQKYGGQCHCKPGVTGRTCDKCIAGFYNFSSQGCSGNIYAH